MAILGELPLGAGTIKVKGKVGYASQQAWIYNSSLRHNIIFGKDYDKERYNHVIKVCALERVGRHLFLPETFPGQNSHL